MAHYEFVHQVLPDKVFHPSILLWHLQNLSPEMTVNYLWTFVETRFIRAGLEFNREREVAGTVIQRIEAGELDCYLVTMPDARYPIEAYFAAMIFGRETQAPDALSGAGHPQRWYFTLERSHDGATPTGTVLCGWSESGTHLNYGPGPAPEANAFN
jgi:hypothetical protein